MENDLKDFIEKVKDEFKKAKKLIEDLKTQISSFEERLTKLEGQRKEPDKDEGWL